MFNPLDLLFPRSNAHHSSISNYLTPAEITSLPAKLKPLTKSQNKVLESIFVASPYSNYLVQDLINRVKLEGETAIIESLSDLIYRQIFIEANYFVPDPDILVPVAADPRRELVRGFSLQHSLAKQLAQRIENSQYHDILRKPESTRPQSELDRKERLKNLKHSFELVPTPPSFSDAEILWLLDDITTTGTTLTENARVLKRAYPFLKIHGITVAGN